MKSHRGRKALTLGELVADIYDSCAKAKAQRILQLAIKTHLVKFCEAQPSAIRPPFQPNPQARKIRFDLPDAPVAAATQDRPSSAQHILVADDNVNIRNLSAEVLIQSGYRANVAADGIAAWEALNADRYDLLITDNSMPRLTGVGLVRKLRAAHMALPVIMATRRLPMEELVKKPSLQLAAMLPKPFSTTELLDTVRVVLWVTYPISQPNQPLPSSQGLEPAGRLQIR